MAQERVRALVLLCVRPLRPRQTQFNYGKTWGGHRRRRTSCVKRLPGITQCASVRRVPVCQERPRARTRGDALCTMLRFARQRRRAKDERKN